MSESEHTSPRDQPNHDSTNQPSISTTRVDHRRGGGRGSRGGGRGGRSGGRRGGARSGRGSSGHRTNSSYSDHVPVVENANSMAQPSHNAPAAAVAAVGNNDNPNHDQFSSAAHSRHPIRNRNHHHDLQKRNKKHISSEEETGVSNAAAAVESLGGHGETAAAPSHGRGRGGRGRGPRHQQRQRQSNTAADDNDNNHEEQQHHHVPTAPRAATTGGSRGRGGRRGGGREQRSSRGRGRGRRNMQNHKEEEKPDTDDAIETGSTMAALFPETTTTTTTNNNALGLSLFASTTTTTSETAVSSTQTIPALRNNESLLLAAGGKETDTSSHHPNNNNHKDDSFLGHHLPTTTIHDNNTIVPPAFSSSGLLGDSLLSTTTTTNINPLDSLLSLETIQHAAAAASTTKTITKIPKPLILPPPPPPPKTLTASSNKRTGGTAGRGFVLLKRGDEYDPHAHELSERLAEAALQDDYDDDAVKPQKQQEEISEKQKNKPAIAKTKTKKPKKKTKSVAIDGNDPSKIEEDDEEKHNETTTAVVSATQALQNIPAVEVSITASTQVKILRNSSSASLSKDWNASLDNGMNTTTPSKILPSNGSKSSKTKSATKKKSSKSGSANDLKANQKAARKFNNEVRNSVEDSDPNRLRELLHDKHNHKFALESTVLEMVLKATVMAAMFEDALYCLRNCTLPSTLSVHETERILQCFPQNLRTSNAYTAADMINALCIATKFETPTARTHFLRIVRGIALEFLEEATSARDRICSAPCERLVRAGVCVVEAKLERGKKPADVIVKPGENFHLGLFISENSENRGIQAGDAVSVLPYAGPYPISAESLDRNMIEATVVATNPFMVLRLQDKMNAQLNAQLTDPAEGNVYRIDKLANRMGFNRQLAAAVSIASPLLEPLTDGVHVRDPRRPCPQLIKAITAMDENIMTNLQRQPQQFSSSSNELTTTAAICSQAVPWSIQDESDENYNQDAIRAEAQLALEKYGAYEGLNESQQLAVAGAICHRLTLVQGPPGTGKTRIAIRILEHWARLAKAAVDRGENPSPILATSDSNIAVDNLVEGCAAVGIRVVRLGRPEAIRPELLRYCIDRPPSSYEIGAANSNSENRPNTYSPYGGGSSTAVNYKERMKQLKAAQVICCTCIGSGGDILDSLGPFERVLVDEATQATEAAVLVPMMRGVRQLVLVGDHCQLPPTVLSTRAEEEGHGVPLFSRMVACGVPPFMLDTQYRMHPCIAMFPSDLFYGGLLKNGVTAPERRPLAGFPWPREEFPVAFIPVYGTEMDDGVSKYNEAEAEVACETVQQLLEGGQCGIADIAVVTPYAAQARLIRRMTKSMLKRNGPPYIEVSSVDGFQGREKEAVVFSAVRSNDYGAIGFTSDWRRINVSFTRARRALIVIGNDQTLRRGDPETWAPWLAWADAHGVNMEKPGIPRGRYEPEQLRRVRGGTTAAEMLKDVLARQQAQLKLAEKQQERAVKNSEGHIIGTVGDDEEERGDAANKQLSLEEDLARLQNVDRNWDDTDDEDEAHLPHSTSKVTLTSASSSNYVRGGSDGDSEDNAVDVWDL